MAKDFEDFIELMQGDEFKSMLQSAINSAIEQNGGTIDANNAVQVASDISFAQSINIIRLYHSWTYSNCE